MPKIRFAPIIVLITSLGISTVCASAEPIKIASIDAFSGVAAESNRASLQGVRYGVAEINRRGDRQVSHGY